MYYLHKTTSAVSCVKPNASQWEATLRDDVGFATVYRRIYRRRFLTLSNQTSRYIRECIRICDILSEIRRHHVTSLLIGWHLVLRSSHHLLLCANSTFVVFFFFSKEKMNKCIRMGITAFKFVISGPNDKFECSCPLNLSRVVCVCIPWVKPR